MLFCYKSDKYNEFWSTDTENRLNVWVPLPGLSLFHTLLVMVSVVMHTGIYLGTGQRWLAFAQGFWQPQGKAPGKGDGEAGGCQGEFGA